MAHESGICPYLNEAKGEGEDIDSYLTKYFYASLLTYVSSLHDGETYLSLFNQGGLSGHEGDYSIFLFLHTTLSPHYTLQSTVYNLPYQQQYVHSRRYIVFQYHNQRQQEEKRKHDRYRLLGGW